jgi:hypothetical protein
MLVPSYRRNEFFDWGAKEGKKKCNNDETDN